MNNSLINSLNSFEDILTSTNPNLSKRLRAGLSKIHIISAFAAVGINAPEELVTLYQWHDGIDYASIPSGQNKFCPEGVFMPLNAALIDYADAIEEDDSAVSSNSLGLYDKSFFPITNSDSLLYKMVIGHQISLYAPSLDVLEPVQTYDSLSIFFKTITIALSKKIINYGNNMFFNVDFKSYALEAIRLNKQSIYYGKL